MKTTLTFRAGPRPLPLCFEPWATEFTVEPQTAVLIEFDSEVAPVEVAHHPDGVTFLSFGRHPDVFGEEGEPLQILSDTMPETPSEVPIDAFRAIMALVAPPR